MLRFVVALQAEARPLADLFGLQAVEEGGPFRVFRGAEGWLIVSGLGKAAAAAATAYLHLLAGGGSGCAWLNVGVGGHSRRAVGEMVLAHKISDLGSGVSWYPQLVLDAPCPTAPLLTVERVEEEYSPPWVYEMEAAGFFPTACRFSTAELVHALKVVSDNPEATLSRRKSSSFVQELIERNLPEIESFAHGLAALARDLAVLATDPPGYAEALASCRFTVAEQRRLRRLLQRLAVLAPSEPATDVVGAARPVEARDVLRLLEERLAALPVLLPEPVGAAAPGVPADDLH
jgi:nucleoside phosphorylase